MVLTGRSSCLKANKVRTKFLLSALDRELSRNSHEMLRFKERKRLDELASLSIRLIRIEKLLLNNEQATHSRHNARRRQVTSWR